MEFFDIISDWLWTYVVITMLVGCALYFTWNLRAVQFTMLPTMLRNLCTPTESTSTGKKVSSFQAFAISLSSRVGTGNRSEAIGRIKIWEQYFNICWHYFFWASSFLSFGMQDIQKGKTKIKTVSFLTRSQMRKQKVL